MKLNTETKLSIALVILFFTTATLFMNKGPTETEEQHSLRPQLLKTSEITSPIREAKKTLVMERALKIGELSRKISLLKQERRKLWAKLSHVSPEDSVKSEIQEAFEEVKSLNEEISILSGKMLKDLKEVRSHES
ncbi:MAG: hypothetical protein V4598_08015 [Bdellovibrionota bacterium]